MAQPLDPEERLVGHSTKASENVKDLTAGAAGGVVHVLIGQPFDLVKVRLQTAGHGNPLNTAYRIWTQEGPLAFYKGSLMPLIGTGACVSIQFGAFHGTRKIFESQNSNSRHNHDSSLSYSQLYLAGGVAGLANSVISGPMEHIRIKLQMQPHGSQKIYSGPIHCVQSVYKQAGLSGIYRGQIVTLWREFHGFGVWFAVYEALLAAVMKDANQTREQLPGWKIALCGGLAGDALWLAVYPLDVIKTKLQSDGVGSKRLFDNSWQVMKETWQRERFRGFFAGLSPTLVRTLLTSAGTFVTVEQVRRWMT